MSRTKEALQIIEKSKPVSFRLFAQLFWPNSMMHRTVKNCGNGARRGFDAVLYAGSYLGKLRKKGLIIVDRHRDTYDPIAYLTDDGRKFLEAKQ